MEIRELDLYREVSSMTGEVLFAYSIPEDIMTMYKGDDARKGASTIINNYVAMLKNQSFSEEYRDNMNQYISALSTGEQSYFTYDIKTKIGGYQEGCYTVKGKTVYNDDNIAVSVIGKLFPIEGNSTDSGYGKLDRSTGVLKAGEFRNQLAIKYTENDGKPGGFIILSLSEIHKPTGGGFEGDINKLYINIAQCLARLFSYNTLIGRLKKDEFGVVYFGRDVSGEFLSKIEDLKQEVNELVSEELQELGVHICGGVTCENFVNDHPGSNTAVLYCHSCSDSVFENCHEK